MAMDLATGGRGSKHAVRPSMNVTPLVDVVLVLLIIFMVIAPMMVKQFWLHVPKKETAAATEEASSDGPVPVVLTVRADKTVWINKDKVELEELGEKLNRIFAARTDRLVFFDADDAVAYGDAMRVLDAARGGGAANIAVLTEAAVR
ncbi:MAG: biopolymer transporter ExbD [Myxococcales bacterium]|nr:biopolymer transporter ExbD [Myxococcales bacterium]